MASRRIKVEFYVDVDEEAWPDEVDRWLNKELANKGDIELRDTILGAIKPEGISFEICPESQAKRHW